MAINNNTENRITTDIDQNTVTQFSIQADASLFQALTKNIYNDVILAGIRELSTNAIDACIEGNLPVKWEVHIPTIEKPLFSVRDYGTGLAKEDLLGMYSVVGASTKRNSNKLNGQFGMGRLSPLAYASSFTVSSFYNGERHSFLVSIQEGIPCAIHLESTTTTEPNGLYVFYDVKPSDVQSFEAKARKLYTFFDHQPQINIDLVHPEILMDQDYFMLTSLAQSGALMGNIFYPFDTSEVRSHYSGLVLKIPIGQLSITPGRESLTYDEKTTSYLREAIQDAEKVIIAEASRTITNKPTDYEKLCAYEELYWQVPYSCRSSLTIPSVTNTHVVQGHAKLKIPDCEVLGRHPSYQKLRTDTRVAMGSLKDTPIFIVDQSRYTEALAQVAGTRVVVLRPTNRSKTAIQPIVDNIIKTLDNLDLDYTKASDYTVTPKAKSTHAIQYLSNSHGSDFGGRRNYTSKKPMLYVAVNGNHCESYSSDYLGTVKKLLRNMAISGRSTPSLVGVQKKYLSAVKAHPNFTELTDFLKTIAFSVHVGKLAEVNDPLRYMSYTALRALEAGNPKFPTDLLAAYKELKAYKKPDYIYTEEEFTELQTSSPLLTKTVAPSLKYDLQKILDRYPLFSEVSHNLEHLLHYFALEDSYVKVPRTS